MAISVRSLPNSLKGMEMNDINRLFSLSLVDPSSWEENLEVPYNERDIVRGVSTIMKRPAYKGLHFCKGYVAARQSETKDTIRKQFYTGNVTNIIVAFALHRAKIYAKPDLSGGPSDVRFEVKWKGKDIGCIEIKRILSTGNIVDYIQGFESNTMTCARYGDHCRHLGLLLFPVVHSDLKYARQLVDGYQRIAPFVIEESRRDRFKFVAMPVNPDGKAFNNYALDEIVKIAKEFIVERGDRKG